MTKRKQLETLLEIEAEAREKIRSLRAKNKALAAENAELENEISSLICVNEALAPKNDDEKEKLAAENAELRMKLSTAENKLAKKAVAESHYIDVYAMWLDLALEEIRKSKKQNEQERNRAEFLLEANEMLAEENRCLRRKIGEPEKAVTLDKAGEKND